jgi:starvation-inducible DNA-binding protein
MINETNPELIKAMKIAFATEYSFYLKAHFYHWNVEGSDFSQYHTLFGGIYQEVYGAIDPFAENIRKLGSYTPGSYTRFSMLSQIDDELTVQPAMQMIQELLEDGEKVLKVLDMVYDLSEGARQFGISNFLAERIDAHQFHNWMLRATLS